MKPDQHKSSTRKPFYCPCCGYRGLRQNPYASLQAPPYSDLDEAPYDERFSHCSHEGCHCCGYEFGYDDNVGACGQAISLRDYRRFWIKDGCHWFHGDDPRPKNWTIAAQLAQAGIALDL